MVTLAIDTSDARGSVALLRNKLPPVLSVHQDSSDYSSWLLYAISQILAESSTDPASLELLAVSTGPGSFTGLRIGLTTVKAWAALYHTPVVGVSRLLAIASSIAVATPYVASSFDAHRGQLFGALYRSTPDSGLARSGEELVATPEEFLQFATARAGSQPISWAALDPSLLSGTALFSSRSNQGDSLQTASPVLAPVIAQLAIECANRGDFSDPITLDADYVRRSDAELFWKDPSAHG